ncbi:hypothetical protein MEX01_28810 [Methylorubrum extorquens]|uniref:PIN domain-containing protein n=1 Tax=Methylorubrum extorquens TaxID=408 RepID=UPI001167B03A|nr:PIN domain-containing protein [Methylorubrum extorquens]GEL42290.1 hypothetical protein MEX01_28810 [Methylorubrum extorquens]
MFANRFTALVDACALAGVLKRNLLLTLAEAEFYRIRWSPRVLDETQRAIERMLVSRKHADPTGQAAEQRRRMEAAFAEASVIGSEAFLGDCQGLPDPDDAHVVAAALQTRASVIVTDNLKHFPETILSRLSLYARSTDAFLADTITPDQGRAVAAIGKLRQRLHRPEKSAGQLLLDMEANGLTETVDVLRPFEKLI